MATDNRLCKSIRDLTPHLFRPQMHVLTRRLLEIDTTADGNNHRCYIYNQRRREIEGPSSAPRWWACTYRFNRYLLPIGSPEPAVKYFYR
jgi:hypothetical protein